MEAAEKCGFSEQVDAIKELLEKATTEEVTKVNSAAAAKPAVQAAPAKPSFAMGKASV